MELLNEQSAKEAAPNSEELEQWIEFTNSKVDMVALSALRRGKLMVKFANEPYTRPAEPETDLVLLERLEVAEEKLIQGANKRK